MLVRMTAIVWLLAGTALAAEDRTATVGGRVSALNIDSATDLSVSGSFEYRFSRVVGLELDATWAPELTSPFPRGPVSILAGSTVPVAVTEGGLTGGVLPPSSLIFPPPTYTNPGGRAVIVSNNVRVVIPTDAARLEPYFVAGGGIASVRHTADLVYSSFGFSFTSSLPVTVVPPQPIRTFTQRVTSSSIDLALTLGGGLGVRTMSDLWIDADLRLIRLLGNEDRNAGRFGVGVRYRF